MEESWNTDGTSYPVTRILQKELLGHAQLGSRRHVPPDVQVGVVQHLSVVGVHDFQLSERHAISDRYITSSRSTETADLWSALRAPEEL